MKKVFTILVAMRFLFFLTACADGEAGQTVELPAPEEKQEVTFQEGIIEMENGSPGMRPAENEVGGDASAGPGGYSSAGESAGNVVDGDASAGLCSYPLAEPAESTVVCEAEDRYLSVSLPDTWEYRIKSEEDMEKEGGPEACAIDFWPEAFPEAVFEMGYWQQFGMCGTGVTIEEIMLPGGLTGYRYSEEIENTLWMTIIFEQQDNSKADGLYVIMASPELSVWEQIEPEFEAILDSVEISSAKN